MRITSSILVLTCLTAGSCTRSPSLTPEDIEGVYASGECPAIRIVNTSLIVEGDVLKGRLINIKGDNIIETYRSVFYYINNENCYLITRNEPRYNSIEKRDDKLFVRILSIDRRAVREWVRVNKN